ncbi:MAG: hypothetical protein PHC56_01705 [Herbinix sp.]|nr:hypothetical protein [Herbinix sp.]
MIPEFGNIIVEYIVVEIVIMIVIGIVHAKSKKKWTQRYRNWDLVLSQLCVVFEDRLAQYL